MDKFILQLNERFETMASLFTAASLPTLKTIDKYRGQPINPEQFDLFPLPALFIERSIQWQKQGKYYNGIMTVNFHLLQDATWATENFSTGIEEGLKQYQFISLVRRVLDEFESENTGKLQRVSEAPVDADVCIYDMLTYQCHYQEPAPLKLYTETAGDALNLTKEIKEQL
jgi:hypothetical protein